MTYPDRINGSVIIGGVDVTDYIEPLQHVRIENVLSRKVDTCKVVLERASALDINSWDEIVVLDGATRIFGGFVTDINDGEGSDLDADRSITGSDYSIRLEKAIVKEEFVDMSDAEILDALFTEYLPGEGYDAVDFVTAVKTHTRLRFNRKTLLDCIIRLADLAKADFFIDYDKKLHYFATTAAPDAAPFSLSDNPNLTTSMPYNNLEVNRDGSKVTNRVEVVGGNYRSEDTEFFLQGTGQEKRILLPFKLHAPDGESSILVYRNDGTELSPIWTPLNVKVGYIEELTDPDDVLFFFQEKVIELGDNWPDLANAAKIEAKFEVPLRTRVSDEASIAHFGMVFDGLIVDNTIVDKPTARLAALAELTANAIEATAIGLDTAQPGLRAGQTVTLVNSIHALNTSYLVQKVIAEIGVAGKVSYHADLGTYNPDLVDLVMLLSKRSSPVASWQEDEVLDELLQKVEALELSEAIDLDTSSSPYYFSENPALAFVWGFGTFSP
jgi:hypothetical protein